MFLSLWITLTETHFEKYVKSHLTVQFLVVILNKGGDIKQLNTLFAMYNNGISDYRCVI